MTCPASLYRIHAIILIKPLLPGGWRRISNAFSPHVKTRTIPLIVLTLEFQSLMRKLRLFRPACATTKRPLLLHRWTLCIDRARVRTRILAGHRPPPPRRQKTRLRLRRRLFVRRSPRLLAADAGQVSWRFAFASRPARLFVAFPEHEAAEERAVGALDVAPGPLAPAEDAYVCEAHEALAERREQRQGEDGMLREAVAVAHAVDDERDQPHGHVDDRVDEEDS